MADKATPAISGAANPAAKPTPTPITAALTLDSPSPWPLPGEFALCPILMFFRYGLAGLSLASTRQKRGQQTMAPIRR